VEKRARAQPSNFFRPGPDASRMRPEAVQVIVGIHEQDVFDDIVSSDERK
jgi:hypothetical protein